MCAVALAGCGGGSEQDQARSAAKSFLAALGRHDGAKACSLSTPNGRDVFGQLGDIPCATGVQSLDYLAREKIGRVRVTGKRALVEIPGPRPGTITLLRSGGGWKVDGAG